VLCRSTLDVPPQVSSPVEAAVNERMFIVLIILLGMIAPALMVLALLDR